MQNNEGEIVDLYIPRKWYERAPDVRRRTVSCAGGGGKGGRGKRGAGIIGNPKGAAMRAKNRHATCRTAATRGFSLFGSAERAAVLHEERHSFLGCRVFLLDMGER